MSTIRSASKQTSRRTYLAGGTAAALLAVWLAVTSAAGALTGPVTVTYMSNLVNTHPAGNARSQLLDEFNKTNTQKITVDVRDGQAVGDERQGQGTGGLGNPPGIFYAAYYNATEFFTAGMTIDLEPDLKGEKDWPKQRGDMFPNMLESNMWAGKLVAMPGYTNNVATMYNPGLLTQAGVAAPKQGWTWDDFTALAQKVVKPGIVAIHSAGITG